MTQVRYILSTLLLVIAPLVLSPLALATEEATASANSVDVKDGDMLWNVAKQMQPDQSVSVYQVMAALIKSNPDAFINGDPNRMKSGVTLTLDTAELSKMDHAQAVAMFKSFQSTKPGTTTSTSQPTTITNKSSAQDKAKAQSDIKQRIAKELQTTATSIKESAIPGIYEVVVPPRVFYVSADGRYVLTGDMVDLTKGVNLTEAVRDTARIASLENVGEENMIVFAPKGEVKHTISVFTDIDCGYCRKLHNEMADYNKLGIKVRYLAYPRAGVGSKSYQKAVTVWCSDDKRAAMTKAKNGQNMANKECKNPVQAQMALGKELGVSGTPALMLENGQLYPGYAPADRLIKILDQVKAQQVSNTK